MESKTVSLEAGLIGHCVSNTGVTVHPITPMAMPAPI